jgi:hypothetical protein
MAIAVIAIKSFGDWPAAISDVISFGSVNQQ